MSNKEVRWRPPNWKNPYRDNIFPDIKRWKGLTFLNPGESFEAGADALYDVFCEKIDSDEFIHQVLEYEGHHITGKQLRDWLKGIKDEE